VEHVRPALADNGDERRVDDGVAALLRRGTGAELQRRVLRESGDPRAVVRAAVALTHGEPDESLQTALRPTG
jgi:carboxylate-amine ligase